MASDWERSLLGSWRGNSAWCAGCWEKWETGYLRKPGHLQTSDELVRGISFNLTSLLLGVGVVLEIQEWVCYNVERLEEELVLAQPKDLMSIDFLQDSNCIPVRQDFFFF